MKKFILLLLVLFMGLSLASCEEDTPDTPVDPGPQTSPNLTADDILFFEKVESYVRSFIKSPTRQDLKLKTTYYSTAVEISYISSNPNVLTNDGKYIEHEYDEEVVLKCVVKLEDKMYVFDINITSTGIPDSEKLEITKNWLDNYFKTTEIKEGTVLPTTHPDYGGRIRWVCEDPTVIVDNKTVNLPVNGGLYRLIAEITFPTPAAYEIVQYPVLLNATSLSKEERTINFIKQSITPTVGSFINLYDGTEVVINRDHIINIEDDLVQHWHSGYKQSMPQSALDRVYEGYELKNDDNVLWVVVHETGMARSGITAEYLAKSQYQNAYVGGGREASWNYTVDDGTVYQSYEDNVACWHASDGSTKGGGNRNGIGIEMCVNTDGEFNAAMRSDARLIAHLLRTYNLGMANIKQHFDFAYNDKNCPENIRNDRRWFEMLGMIAREYTSVELLQDVDVEYNVKSNNTEDWKLAGVYKITDNNKVTVEVKVFGKTFTVTVENE